VGNTAHVSEYISFTGLSALGQKFSFLPAVKVDLLGTSNSASILYISILSLRCLKGKCKSRSRVWNFFHALCTKICRSHRPRDLRRGSAAARLLGLRIRISPGAWMSVSRECCGLSGGGLCDGPITRPEESYRVWCVLSAIVKPRQ
jgi:hypothetical protein